MGSLAVSAGSPARRRVGRSGWLPLGAAARLVGVDPDTLRRWADDGRIEAFTTPGGHRRFRRSALESLTARRRTASGSLLALGATPERLVAAYRRAYRAGRERRSSPQDAAGSPTAPLATLSPAARAAFRVEGRHLVAALVATLDGGPDARRERERVAADCCARMARRLAGEGRSLGEAIAAFVLARRPFLAEIGRLGARRALDPASLARCYDEAAALLDRLLLAFVAAHQAAVAERAGSFAAPSPPAPSPLDPSP